MGTSGEAGERRVNDSLTQGDQEGGAPQGASPDGTRTLFVKWRADGSTSVSSIDPRHLASVVGGGPIPSYPTVLAARQDRDFQGGLFWVVVPTGRPGLGSYDDLLKLSMLLPLRYREDGPREELPKDTNPKTVYGEAKPSLSLLPGPALVEIAGAMREGKAKYGSMNWRTDPVSSTTYADAALRHLFQWLDGEDRCPKSRAYHLAHVAANAMILLDAELQGTLIDDRPPTGTTSAAIDRNTRDIKGLPFDHPGFQGGYITGHPRSAQHGR